jgi:hypothetical protein
MNPHLAVCKSHSHDYKKDKMLVKKIISGCALETRKKKTYDAVA